MSDLLANPQVYLDTSVLLAQVLAEDVRPPAELWRASLYSSRLLEFEMHTRLHASSVGQSVWRQARHCLSGVHLVELLPPATARALEAFPLPLRTLDALHLAALCFLRSRHIDVALATYDRRMREVAEAMKLPLVDLRDP